MNILLVAINSKYTHTNLGMHCLYNYARSQGLVLSLIEEAIQVPILTVLAEITARKPDLVGINVHIWNRNYVYELAALVRQVLPKIVIVLGGPEVGFTPELAKQECQAADYIICGEGEETFLSLCQDLEQGQHPQLSTVPTVVADLSSLPFPYENLPQLVAEHKLVYYECSRGCPFTCSYCLSGISHAVRRRPLNLVLADLQKFMDAKVPLVKFVDRTYNLDENYYLPILQFLAKADTETTFHCEIKADLLSEQVLAFLATMPKKRLQFEIGVQTTNTETLRAIGRQDNWLELSSNVQRLLSYGNIHVHLDLIAGLPYEDFVSWQHSFNAVYKLQPQMLQLGFLKVLRGAAISLQQKEHGILHMAQPPYEVLATKYLNYEQMRFLKVLEDVFDHTYNTGKYQHSLNFLVQEIYGGVPFACYSAITSWWERHQLYEAGHSVREAGLLLLGFVQEMHPGQAAHFAEILRFDIFLGQPNWRPEELCWHTEKLRQRTLQFWRNLKVVHKYFPEYEFTTWRKLRKYLPVESFTWTPQAGFGSEHYILADYTNPGCYLELEEF